MPQIPQLPVFFTNMTVIPSDRFILCSAGQIIPKAANRSTRASDPVVSPQSDTSDTVNARSQASAGRSAALPDR